MKAIQLTTLLSICLVSTLLGQEIKYSEIATRTTKFEKNYLSYTGKNGTVYKVGDRLKIGMPFSKNHTFTFILNENERLDARFSGFETEIKKIRISGNNSIGYMAYFIASGAGLSNLSIQIENALEVAEIRSTTMTSDEALAELKRAKDKLDLGLITQQKYDSIKTVLSKFIH